MQAIERFQADHFQLRHHLERFLTQADSSLDSRLTGARQRLADLSQQEFSWPRVDEFYKETVGEHYLFELAGWHMDSDDYITDTLRLVQDFAQGRVLDFGGGIGTHTLGAALSSQVEQVVFCDINPHNRAFVAKRVEWLGLADKVRIVPSLDADACPDPHFDTVVCFDVFEHLPDPVAQLHQFHSCLPEGGKLIGNWYFHKGQDHEFPFHLDDPVVIRQFMETLQSLFIEEFHPYLITARCYSRRTP